MYQKLVGEKCYLSPCAPEDAEAWVKWDNVMLGTFAFNQRAIHCYERVGFKAIGRRRQARIMGGVKHDAILMDILAEEFESQSCRSEIRA